MRWAAVLGLELREYQELTSAERLSRIHEASKTLLEDPSLANQLPPGVLGAEFSRGQRWELVEYLKTL